MMIKQNLKRDTLTSTSLVFILRILILWFFLWGGLFANEREIKIVTTFTVIADIVKNVVGEFATVESITKAGAEIHNYQVTPRDIRRAYGSDLIFYNGLNLEIWFNKFYQNLNSAEKVVLTKNIKPIAISQGPYNGKPNPHAWMSPKNALIYVDNITEALVEIDETNADYYKINATKYKIKITKIADKFRKKIEAIPSEKRWLVTSEGAFSYLAEDFDLKELFIWPINADGNGTPDQVKSVIEAIKANQIPVIFSESTVSSKPALQIARETGANYGGVLYVDSLSGLDGDVPTYLDLLNVTLTTITNGFN